MGQSLRSEITGILNHIPIDFGGGCSADKAYMMAWLIRRHNLKTTVDIGVYRGRSLFPQAWAHRQHTGGVVYGVDPWSAAEAMQYDNPTLKEVIERFVNQTDYQAMYEEVLRLRGDLGLENHCTILRSTSRQAISYFEEHQITFDLVHIDGNHDAVKVMGDLNLYVARSTKPGFIVLDDASWESVRPAYESLAAALPLVFERLSGLNRGAENDYAIFWNGASEADARRCRRELQGIGADS